MSRSLLWTDCVYLVGALHLVRNFFRCFFFVLEKEKLLSTDSKRQYTTGFIECTILYNRTRSKAVARKYCTHVSCAHDTHIFVSSIMRNQSQRDRMCEFIVFAFIFEPITQRVNIYTILFHSMKTSARCDIVSTIRRSDSSMTGTCVTCFTLNTNTITHSHCGHMCDRLSLFNNIQNKEHSEKFVNKQLGFVHSKKKKWDEKCSTNIALQVYMTFGPCICVWD